MTTFTASEVRRQASTFGRGRVNNMLNAFADMLEAQEKAVPVAVVKDSEALYTGYLSWTGESVPPETKLYTHPAPSDAERLAEALHNLRDAQKHYMEHRTSASEIREPLGQLVAQRAAEADAVLATYSAQVQPPYHECDHT